VSALAVDQTVRRSRQLQIEALLTELDDRRRELYRLRANGVRRAGMRDLKREFLVVREHLRDVVAPPS
jgi:DNA-directed RNA polymerase sigma subunit (sigma70/sigma32)